MFLTKEQILEADDLPTEEVEAWGGKVLVIALSAEERENLRLGMGENENDLLKVAIKLVSLTVVDENKNRVFSEEDIEALEKKSAKEIDKVFAVAQKLSGLGVNKELEKNSEGQSVNSNSN
jgi:hypothetical protein